MIDVDFMLQALAEAKNAAAAGEVPIGAVVVKNGEIIARGRNRVEEKHTVSAHAEFEAIHEAENILNDWRMSDCTIYVTKEPCPMCAGMLINSRIKRIVFGAPDPAGGFCGGAFCLYISVCVRSSLFFLFRTRALHRRHLRRPLPRLSFPAGASRIRS